jgi:2-hydroxychromene-2-carboxylate isomerase
VRALARHYGAELKLRFILPMVMRGLPVPPAKSMYIMRDTKREADRVGMPFGRIVDPRGAATERAIAVLHRAIPLGKGEEFSESFLRGVWSEGIDGATNAGLERVAARAGLDEAFVREALKDESWRPIAEANRQELFAMGLWGAPTLRVDDRPAHWGQDRLWAVEDDLIAATEAKP